MKTTEQKKPAVRARVNKELDKIDPVKASQQKLERVNKLLKGVALPKLPLAK